MKSLLKVPCGERPGHICIIPRTIPIKVIWKTDMSNQNDEPQNTGEANKSLIGDYFYGPHTFSFFFRSFIIKAKIPYDACHIPQPTCNIFTILQYLVFCKRQNINGGYIDVLSSMIEERKTCQGQRKYRSDRELRAVIGYSRTNSAE